MSKDIYERFKSAQEALAAQKAAEELGKLRRLREAQYAELAAERQARNLKLEREYQERLRVMRLVAEKTREIPPVRSDLTDLLMAIKDHDPVIQATRFSGVSSDLKWKQTTSGEVEVFDLIQLFWGNHFGSSFRETLQPNNPGAGKLDKLRKLFNSSESGSGYSEDFYLVSIAVGPTEISTYGSGVPSAIGTDAFIRNNDEIMPSLVDAIQNPIRRFFRYGNGISGGIHPPSRTTGIFDQYGKAWDRVEVDPLGRLNFMNVKSDEPGLSYHDF